MLLLVLMLRFSANPNVLRTNGKFAGHTHNDVVTINAQRVLLTIGQFSRAHMFIYKRFTAEFSNNF
jgi:hypothetical protein